MRIFSALLVFLALVPSVKAFSAPAGDDWRYKDIIDLIDEQARLGKPFRTPRALIKALPVELRSHFTFVYETGNRFQEASLIHPRALSFNKRLVYTFNGHRSQKGFNTIELMELDELNQKLELREITFTRHGKTVKVDYSKATPQKCLQCHGASPRPIWAQYSTWPGVYGSNHDQLTAAEKKGYADFQKEMRGNPKSRYALLVYPPGSSVTPYADVPMGYGMQPNLVFTKLMTRFNTIRLLGALKESPGFETYRWLIPVKAHMNKCILRGEVENDFQKRLAKDLAERRLTSVPQKSVEKILALLGVPVSRFQMSQGNGSYDYEDGSQTQLRLLTDALLIQLAEKDPKLKPSLTLSRIHTARYLVDSYYEWFDDLVPQVSLEDCKVLYEHAEAAIKAAPIAWPSSSANGFTAQLKAAEEAGASTSIPISCVFCHVVGTAPPIPFTNEAELRKALGEEGGRLHRQLVERTHPKASRRMPPPSSEEFGPLSETEHGALSDYLKGLTP